MATTTPFEPVAQVHRLASTLFCASGWPALMAVASCRTIDPRAVLEVLRAEEHRAQSLGCWGNWPRVNAKLRAMALDASPGDRRRSRRTNAPTTTSARQGAV